MASVVQASPPLATLPVAIVYHTPYFTQKDNSNSVHVGVGSCAAEFCVNFTQTIVIYKGGSLN